MSGGIPSWARVGAKVVLKDATPGRIDSPDACYRAGDICIILETDIISGDACCRVREENGRWESGAWQFALLSRFRPLATLESDIAEHFAQHLHHSAPRKVEERA